MARALPPPFRPRHFRETRIKICGITREEDARLAASLGADFLGLLFAPSQRRVVPSEVAGWVREVRDEYPATAWVGVFVDPSDEELDRTLRDIELDLIQVHGSPTAKGRIHELARRRATGGLPWVLVTPPGDLAATLVSIRQVSEAIERETSNPEDASPYAYLVDSVVQGRTGGTGQTFDWSVLPPSRPEALFLAGGLDASNVGDAIHAVRPFAVDASSRLEAAPGQKDAERVRAFVTAIRTLSDEPM